MACRGLSDSLVSSFFNLIFSSEPVELRDSLYPASQLTFWAQVGCRIEGTKKVGLGSCNLHHQPCQVTLTIMLSLLHRWAGRDPTWMEFLLSQFV